MNGTSPPPKKFRSALLIPLALLSLVAWVFREPLRNGVAFVVASFLPNPVSAASPGVAVHGYNGFTVTNSIIPVSEILSGGPGRDGIPAIDHPVFVSPEDAGFMRNEDLVVSVTVGEITRAYPLRVLVWHEIVNDEIEGIPIAVTYCPLCGTAMVFDRIVQGRILTFGVSGLLYQSDVLMYDRETASLWSQLKMKAVSGDMVKGELAWRPSSHLAWAAWKDRHPDGQVLSTDTGHLRNYDVEPYEGYEESPFTMFPVPEHRDDLPNKEWVLGVVNGTEAKAYRLASLPVGEVVSDIVGGSDIVVSFDPAAQEAIVTNVNRQEPMPYVKVYWFAWQAFYPDTGLWQEK